MIFNQPVKWPVIAFIVVIFLPNILCQINMTEYYKMPPIALMDDYDRCLYEFPDEENIYCIVKTAIKPNDSSALYSYIYNFSSNYKRHFRHDLLDRGICLKRCKKLIMRLDKKSRQNYYVENFGINNTQWHLYDMGTLDGALMAKIRHGELVNECINYEMKKAYGLMGYSVIEYCITNKEQHPIDEYDITFIVILSTIFMLLILSTIYDYRNKKCETYTTNREYYSRPIHGKVTAFLVSFSMTRNWYRLTSESKSELARDLRSINAIRPLVMFGVIVGHCVLFQNALPQMNTEYMEKNFYRFVTMILINGSTVIQGFFAISGFLLSANFLKQAQNEKSVRTDFLWKAIINRYLRLTPVYAFVILLHASVMVHLQDGPFWNHVSGIERSYCRQNWWTNLLYINNYVKASEPCAQHGWYLAADFQLTIIGLIYLLLSWKWPKVRTILMTLMIIASFVIPGVVTYLNKFEGVFLVTPEADKYSHLYDEEYQKLYIPAYTNFGSFLCGLIGGHVYWHYKVKGVVLKKYKIFHLLWFTSIVVAFLTMMSAYIFYEYEFERPSIWLAVYAGFMKCMWGAFTVMWILGIAHGIGWKLREFLLHPFFRFLGRLTFGAYLIHPFLIRVSVGQIRQPAYVSDLSLVQSVMSTYLLSYITAFLLCISMELPVSALQKAMFSISSPADSVRQKTNKNSLELIKSVE